MADRIQSTLKKLASVSQSLNQVSDEISSRIAEVEAALREYKLGVPAWIDLREWSEFVSDDYGINGVWLKRTRRLGYSKKDGRWGLLTYISPEEATDSSELEEFVFLREAPRDVRLEAIDRLPDLLEELVKKAVETSELANKQAEKTKHIVAGLKKKVS